MNVREPRSRQHLLDEAENVVGVLTFHSRVLLDVLEQLVGSTLIMLYFSFYKGLKLWSQS